MGGPDHFSRLKRARVTIVTDQDGTTLRMEIDRQRHFDDIRKQFFFGKNNQKTFVIM
jgi:hypothetical protein